jgi:hypothetical protein
LEGQGMVETISDTRTKPSRESAEGWPRAICD